MTGRNSVSRDGRLRSSWQVLAVYIGASWVVLQVVDVLKDNMGLPDWVFPFAVVLLLIGLPIMLVTAMIQARPAAAAPPQTDSIPAPAAIQSGNSLNSRRLFTWRNALIGGAAAFGLLAVVTTGFMFMRNRGIGPVGSLVAKGVLAERSRIVLAEFDSEDPVLGRTVTESFRADLAQSTIVHLVEPDSIADALSRMGLEPDTELTEDTARELALRDGFPAIVGGEVAPLGDGYVLTARLVSAADGSLLASARASARDQNALLEAIDQTSSKLREQIGESYTALRETPSLAHVTTGSLAALKKYTQAEDARHKEGNAMAAVELLEEAVAIDTTFALAYRDLATILDNVRGSWDRQIEAMESAYRHRERLTERERYLVEATYSQQVQRDPGGAIRAYESMLRLDPGDAQALNNIGFNYWRQGDFDRAGEYYRRAREADPTEGMYAANVGAAWANVGDFDRADSAYAALDTMPRSPLYEGWRAQFEYERGNEAAARAMLASLSEEYASQPGMVGWYQIQLSNLELLHGRLQAAEAQTDGVGDLRKVDWFLSIVQDTGQALALLERAFEPESLEEFEQRPVLDRPWIRLASLAAEAGDSDRAREMVARRDSEVSRRYLELQRPYEHALAALIALAQGDPDGALAEMRQQPPDACPRCRALDLGRLHDRAGQPDSAIRRYREFVETPSNFNLGLDALHLASTHERLGQLYDEQGDTESAALHYAQFVDLWEDADPELQPRVAAARARLEDIVRERG